MKRLKLDIPRVYTTAPIDLQNIRVDQTRRSDDGTLIVDMGTIDFSKVGPEGEVARENGMHVVYAAIHIEKLLNDLLQAHYFGSVDGGDGSKRDVRDSFRHDILETPALQFSFKRTLVTSLVKRCRLLKGKEADTLAIVLRSGKSGATHSRTVISSMKTIADIL